MSAKHAAAAAVLAVGWLWPAVVGPHVCAHLAADHLGGSDLAAEEMLVLQEHPHAHRVADHDHRLAVGSGAPAVGAPAWSAAVTVGAAASPAASGRSLATCSAHLARGSPPARHLLLCTFLT